MSKILITLFSVLLLGQVAYANDVFLNSLKDKRIVFAFADGTVTKLTFFENEYNITTGVIEDENGKVETNLQISFVFDNDGNEWMLLYKDKKSPAGVYKYALYILIPTELDSGESIAFTDFRWGYWLQATVFIELLD